jgi:hypothetical protein
MTHRTLTDTELELLSHTFLGESRAQSFIQFLRMRVVDADDNQPQPVASYSRKIAMFLSVADYGPRPN